MHDELVRQTS